MSMSQESHRTKQAAQSEHGTTRSYVIGFVLSLVFTIVPYYLVVNKVLTGTTLLVIILGIAVVQMTIQLLFFLHLGRGPKPFYNIVFFFATAGVIVLTIGASLFIMNNLYHNMSPQEVVIKQAQEENIAQVSGRETGACVENKDNHVMTIEQGVVSPFRVDTRRCDTLTFVNEDDTARVIVFGVYPDTSSYGGMYEVTVRPGRPETITLNEPGDFIFRDQADPAVTGSFNVLQ